MQPEIEYDPLKSLSTWLERGIWFDETRHFWEDTESITIPAKIVKGEKRHAIIAEYKGEIWCAIFTSRPPKIRIISARRADNKEMRAYKAGKTDHE